MHLCASFPFNPPGSDQYIYQIGGLRHFINVPNLASFTCHDITHQKLPIKLIPSCRYFFARPLVSEMERRSRCDELYRAAQTLSNEYQSGPSLDATGSPSARWGACAIQLIGMLGGQDSNTVKFKDQLKADLWHRLFQRPIDGLFERLFTFIDISYAEPSLCWYECNGRPVRLKPCEVCGRQFGPH